MPEIFADAVYWIGLLNPDDFWHRAAVRASEEHADATIITTEGVLSEVLASVTRLDLRFRQDAVRLVRRLQADPSVVIIPQDHDLFERGLEFYARFAASTLSLQDCISMVVMRERRITDVLTGDAEFRGFGFRLLMQR